MSIEAMVNIWVGCDGTLSNPDCHVEVIFGYNAVFEKFDENRYADMLCEKGWLVLGEVAYCPVCRKELHD
jgi:hypothetical protein